METEKIWCDDNPADTLSQILLFLKQKLPEHNNNQTQFPDQFY